MKAHPWTIRCGTRGCGHPAEWTLAGSRHGHVCPVHAAAAIEDGHGTLTPIEAATPPLSRHHQEAA